MKHYQAKNLWPRRFSYRLYLLAAPICIIAGGNFSVAQAHILKVDHGISAVLHIPPDDKPQAQTPTKLYIAYGDIADSFSLQDCNCQVIIKKNETVVQSAIPRPALPGATLNSYVTVSFPDGGQYEVATTGHPKNGSFPDFELEFPVSVTAVPVTTKHVMASVAFMGIGGLIVLGVAIGAGVRTLSRRRN